MLYCAIPFILDILNLQIGVKGIVRFPCKSSTPNKVCLPPKLIDRGGPGLQLYILVDIVVLCSQTNTKSITYRP